MKAVMRRKSLKSTKNVKNWQNLTSIRGKNHTFSLECVELRNGCGSVVGKHPKNPVKSRLRTAKRCAKNFAEIR